MTIKNKIKSFFASEPPLFVDDVIGRARRNEQQAFQDMQKRLPKEDSDGVAISKGMNGKSSGFTDVTGYLGSFTIGSANNVAMRMGSDSQVRINRTLRDVSFYPIINAILDARTHQVSAYGQPARFTDGGVGFEVYRKDFKDLAREDKKNIPEMEDFLECLGNPDNPESSFRTWAMQIVRDSLIFGHSASEIIYDKNKRIKSFQALDAGTVFRTNQDAETKRRGIAFVQSSADLMGTEQVAEFKRDEIIFGRPNPTTSLRDRGYGISPLQSCLNQIITYQIIEEFNNRYFSQGGTTKGILNIKTGGTTSVAAIDEFRRTWANTTGISGAHQIPVISADDAKFIPINQSMKDMESEKYTNLLINTMCATFSIDSGEINFPNKGGATGSKGNSLQEASKKEASELSQDKGLKPLLDHIEELINRNIMARMHGGKYRFRFTGNKISQQMQKHQLLAEQAKTYKTVAEVRREEGLPDLGEETNYIANQFDIAHRGQLLQAELAKQKDDAEETPESENKDLNGVTKDGQVKDEQVVNKFGKDSKLGK